MKKCRLILNDHVNCTFVGLDGDTLKYFHDKFEFDVPGARFQPKFQLGIWNGRISFFSKIGKTSINFLAIIIRDLVKIGIKPEIVDKRIINKTQLEQIDKDYFSHIIHPDTGNPTELRYYQVDAINALLKSKHGILLSSTGSGKTIITAVLCDIFNNKNLDVIVIVPNKNLLSQTKNLLESLNLDVGEFSGKVKDYKHHTVISTWQALQNTPIIIKEFQCVIVDETHLAKSAVLNSLLNKHGKTIQYRYGLTGTLPKDEVGLHSIYSTIGYIKYEIKASQLIDEGYLSKLHISIYQLKETLRTQWELYLKNNKDTKLTFVKFRNSYFLDYQSEKEYLRTYKPRLNFIINTIQKNSLTGNVFCLIDSKPLGRKLIKELTGEHVYFVSGDDQASDREKIYNLFKDNNNIIVIATSHVASTGIDIARINKLLMIDLGKSFIRIIQSIGRGLRKAKDKDTVDVIDICSDLKYSKRHLAERIRFYKEAEYPFSKNNIDYE